LPCAQVLIEVDGEVQQNQHEYDEARDRLFQAQGMIML
jgi:very-short-patch-repair endonuclease